MSNDRKSDLTADLLHDLAAGAVGARADAVRTEAAAPGSHPVERGRSRRPSLSVVFTPLHWRRVTVGLLQDGPGVSVGGGPWRVDLAV
jgi:hypothetical protein